MFDADNKLIAKWAPVLEHADAPAIDSSLKKGVTARLLENQEIAFAEQRAQSFGSINEAAPTSNTTGVDNYNPVLISMVRRTMPNLIAYDIAGVQPMTAPTGLIFAMQPKYDTQSGGDAFTSEADTLFSGFNAGNANTALVQDADPTGLAGVTDADTDGDIGDEADTVSIGGGTLLSGALTTAEGEELGDEAANAFPEMSFKITSTTVTAVTRALKAEYTMELAQDLKAVHGLDAEAELANILSGEMLTEINREVVRSVYKQAKIGAQNCAVKGILNASVGTDGDTGGRWQAEVYKGIGMQLQFEANAIAKETRRGRGNFAIVSSDVASALAASGTLDYAPGLSTGLAVDDTGNTFAGVLNGSIKIYVDPYATVNSIAVGYRGSNPYDAGIFYCPYVPLTMVKAMGEDTFQPKIGFKTRYGMVANPFASGAARANPYFRIMRVDAL